MKYNKEAEITILDGWKPIAAIIVFDIFLTLLILLFGNTEVFLLINQGLQIHQLDPFIALISNFGVILLIAGGILIFTLDYKYKSIGALTLMIIGFWLAIFLGYTLKTYFDILRPYYQIAYTRTLIYTTPNLGGSFPSSHALISFFIWTIISVKAKKYSIPTLIAASLISFGRVYVGVHYPLDITCGILIGVLLGVAILSLEVVAKRLSGDRKNSSNIKDKPRLKINFKMVKFHVKAAHV
ncbi:MAG: phosphatase PAP2 family protein [Candidatus Odinarchaeum yellowstonii]|uniref:Phosphatase PAP2 family protein n=1 Tax=Odinarchaeota yellowstonii (strain LCB_4) TaxID=1841599 RepID=A0AAF0D2L3_ODILC|nr:MAG: phosphatase PAP2 family protein [Candidatus Odinarchaeum yellowstonii]